MDEDAAIAGHADAIAKLEKRAHKLNDYTIYHPGLVDFVDGNTERVESTYEDAYILDADALYGAAMAGDADAISQFEMRHDMLNKSKETILHIESRNGNTERVRFILRRFAHKKLLSNLDKDKRTALYSAASFGRTEVAEILIDAARHLPPPSDNDNDNPVTSFQAFLRHADVWLNTALHAAVMGGHASIVKLLVEAHPSDTHTKNNEGKTPMYIAVEKGFNDIVEIISTTCTALSLDGPHGSTAVRIKNLDQAKSPGGTLYKIMDEDALYAAAIARDADAIAILEKRADKLYTYEDRTILHIESREGNTERVRFILREFAHKNLLAKLDKCKRTALQLAVYKGRTEVAEILIDAARHLPPPPSDNDNTHDNPVTSFQAFLRQADKYLNTALHGAAYFGHASIVKLLVEADPSDTHIQNDEGKTPIYIAAEKGYKKIVKVICTTCTTPSLEGPRGSTALHAAIKHLDHDIEAVNLLIGAARHLPPSENDNTVTPFQAFLRQGDKDLNTALHIAVMQGKVDIVKLLVEADPSDTHIQALLRQGDQDMNTALHLAVEYGHASIVKLLVEADPSDTHIQNNQGKTPIYIAVERWYIDIVRVICTTCTASPNLDGPGGSTTALHAAIKILNQVKKEDRDVIRLIIQAVKPANNHQYDDGKERLVELFNRTDEKKCIFLELAVEGNHLDVVELILAENPAYRLRKYGDFPHLLGIMPLIYKATDKEYIHMVNLLTEAYQRGLQVNYMAVFSTLANMPELISAIRSHEEESVFKLLDRGKYVKHLVTFADNLGWTALHHAAYHEFNSIIGNIVEAQKKFGHPFVYQDMISTPFHVAAEKGFTSTVIRLMQSWPSSSSAYTAVDKNGQNILHLAALQSKKEMIQGVLKYCPEEYKNTFVNKQDNNGNTPLHLLIKRGCLVPEVFNYRGLDIWVQNNEKRTPPDMLYFEDQIIDDQVQIKVALDDIRIDQTRDIFSSSVLSSKRERKDVILNNEVERMKLEEYARIKDDTHAIANCFTHAIAGDHISKAALEIKADTLNESGETILHVESKKGDIENVRFIVGVFANKSLWGKLDRSKQTALHLAAGRGHPEVVEALIDAARHAHNPVSYFQDFIRKATGPMRNTALHLAVLNGNVAIVKLLVEADPNDSHVQNNEGKTPIYIAAENGYNDIIKEICTTCTALSLDGPGGRTTALHALIQNIGQVTEGASDMIRMMVHAAKRRSSAEDPSLVNFEALFSRTDESGSTVLQLAVEKDFVEAVKLILLEDPAYQPGREIKRNCLMRLIYKAIDNKYSDDIIKSLSETYNAGIDPDHKDVLDLILAIKRRDEVSVLGHLKDAKNLATFKEDNGWTPLHYAVYHEFDSILGDIIEAQEDVGHPFAYANMVSTPFYVAVKHGYTSTVIRLMKSWPAPSSAVTAANSPYTVVDEIGQNILHLAAARNILHLAAADNKNDADNKKEMVQGILKYCPEEYKDKILKQQDTNGNTPLHLLISHGCFIPELIKKGLDHKMVKNNEGWTPLDMLYFQNEIVGDQGRIKIALEDAQTNYQSAWNLWPKSTEKKTNIFESRVPYSKQRRKDEIFDEEKNLLMDAKHEQMMKKLERYKMRTNTQIIVTALITTVTFTVGFTMPGGLYQSGDVNEGLVVLSRKKVFNAFMVSDALALLLSTSSLFLYFLESMNEDPRQVAKLNAHQLCSTLFLLWQ